MQKIQLRAQGLQRDGDVLLDQEQQLPRICGPLRGNTGALEEEHPHVGCVPHRIPQHGACRVSALHPVVISAEERSGIGVRAMDHHATVQDREG